MSTNTKHIEKVDTTQKGALLLIGLLVGSILAVAGIAGYAVWNNTKQDGVTAPAPQSTERAEQTSNSMTEPSSASNFELAIPADLTKYECTEDNLDAIIVTSRDSPVQVTCDNLKTSVAKLYYNFLCTTDQEIVSNIQTSNTKITYAGTEYNVKTSSFASNDEPHQTIYTLTTTKGNLGCAFSVIDRVKKVTGAKFDKGLYPEFDKIVETAVLL